MNNILKIILLNKILLVKIYLYFFKKNIFYFLYSKSERILRNMWSQCKTYMSVYSTCVGMYMILAFLVKYFKNK